jgi:hypothetical protein
MYAGAQRLLVTGDKDTAIMVAPVAATAAPAAVLTDSDKAKNASEPAADNELESDADGPPATKRRLLPQPAPIKLTEPTEAIAEVFQPSAAVLFANTTTPAVATATSKTAPTTIAARRTTMHASLYTNAPAAASVKPKTPAKATAADRRMSLYGGNTLAAAGGNVSSGAGRTLPVAPMSAVRREHTTHTHLELPPDALQLRAVATNADRNAQLEALAKRESALLALLGNLRLPSAAPIVTTTVPVLPVVPAVAAAVVNEATATAAANAGPVVPKLKV